MKEKRTKQQEIQRRAKLRRSADAAVDDPIYSADLRLAALAADAQVNPEKRKELDELLARDD